MTRAAIVVSAAGLFAGDMANPALAELKFAGGALTGYATLTSNYVTRGISNSDNHAAVQGLLEYMHDTGFYAGTFASSVDFDAADAVVEWDGWVGYAFAWRGFAFRSHWFQYFYPGVRRDLSDDFNTPELETSVSYTLSGTVLSARFSWSPDYFFASGDAYYWGVSAGIPVLSWLTLEAHAGHQDIEKNFRLGLPDYNDWSLGLVAAYRGWRAGLTYTDTDVRRGECFPGTTGRRWCDARVIASLTFGF